MSADAAPYQYVDPAREPQRSLLAALFMFKAGASFAMLSKALAGRSWRRADLAEALGRLAEGSSITVGTFDGTARYEISSAARASLARQHWLPVYLQETVQGQLACCEDLVAGAEEALSSGPGQKGWLELLARERPNIDAVLELALRTGNLGAAARMACELCTFWEMRGPLVEASTLLSRLLASGPMPGGARARLLDGLGRVALRQGKYQTACRCFRQALLTTSEQRDQLTRARAGSHLALAQLCSGHPDVACVALEQALVELYQLDLPADIARARAIGALATLSKGRPADSLDDLDRSIALQLAAGDTAGLATALIYRSVVHSRCESWGAMLDDARQAAQVFCELGDKGGTVASLLSAAIALSTDNPGKALRLAKMSARLQHRNGALPVPYMLTMAKIALAPALRSTKSRPGEVTALTRTSSPLEALSRPCEPTGQSQLDDSQRTTSVQALGGFQVLSGGAVLHLPPQVARLVKLVIAGGGRVHVEQAIEALWPEVAPALGKRRLRNVLSKLSHLAGELIVRRASTLQFGPHVPVDALRFESTARDALRALSESGGGSSVSTSISKALAAHNLYSGELLPEDRYEDFAIVARERLTWLHLRLLDSLAAAAAKAHDDALVEHCLRTALDIDPTDEGRYVALARHLTACGRPAAANQLLSKARQLVARLGLPVPPALAVPEAQTPK
ncbi:MAG: BTAD domain-containing putative transcriptional regulator [Acidimicrobiales bacterium]